MTASNDPRSDLQRRILEAVRRRLKKRQFETWFARASVLRLTEAEVVVGVPNSFQQEWMTKEFTGVVAQAALEITGAPVAARFEVEGGAAPRSADSPAPPPTPRDVPAPVAPAEIIALTDDQILKVAQTANQGELEAAKLGQKTPQQALTDAAAAVKGIL